MPKTRAHVFVGGRVQGVFFRQETKLLAEEHSVTGWIKNLEDGRVEAVFEGEADAVNALVEFCRRGPRGAVVTEFHTASEPYIGEFGRFKITY